MDGTEDCVRGRAFEVALSNFRFLILNVSFVVVCVCVRAYVCQR